MAQANICTIAFALIRTNTLQPSPSMGAMLYELTGEGAGGYADMLMLILCGHVAAVAGGRDP